MMATRLFSYGGLCLAVVAACVAAGVTAPAFELTRSTIGSGGVMRSTGGDLEVSGTIGLPEAGTLAGGIFELNGGFWIPIPPGDCEEDGDVDLMDFDRFQVCLSGPKSEAVSPSCSCFDVNHSSSVDLADAAVFQISFTGQ